MGSKWVVVVVTALAACRMYPVEHLAPFVPPENRAAVPSRVATANAYVVGTLQKVQRDWRYEAPCGILASLFRSCADLRAYVARITPDSGSKHYDVLFFVAPNQPGMGNGTHARFLLHQDRVLRGDQCSRYGCLDEFWYVIEDDADVLPT